MAEFGHRVNSEGLRRRDIAPSGGASKRVYIVFVLYFCQPSDTRKKACAAAIFDFFRAGRGSPAAGLGKALIHAGSAAAAAFAMLLRRTAATFLRRSCTLLSGLSPRG